MTEFLLELRCEEIPARMQDKAREDLARLFAGELEKAGIAAGEVVTYATPRRLALIARDLPLETQGTREETKGPKTSAPAQALEGFLRKTGLTQEQLEDRGGIWFATVEKPGRFTSQVLAEAIPAIVRAFPWPKSMRWGAASASTESLRWVRPLHGIVAILGEELVPCAIDGTTGPPDGPDNKIRSGFTTLGHRFHHPGAITIGSADDYVEKLRACHVLVDQEQRKAVIRAGAANEAKKAGLVLVEDEGLVAENAGLTEWPMPMLGRFDPAFLDVPHEVIQLTARVNQKYFVCHDADGKLANAFVLTANIVAADGGAAIVAGNEKVLAARLSDARFFWEQDLKVPLEAQAEKLGQIVFHEKLGTVADKVERVAKLARWLCEEGIVTNPPRSRGGGGEADGGGGERPSDIEELDTPLHRSAVPLPTSGEDLATLAERAARLCKADLVTGMVGEFPELQGVMGGHLARAQGEPDEVADAIRDHYKPVGQGDDVPTAPVTVAVSLADKLDTIFAFFSAGETPTGSRDPFGLRRAAIGVIRTALHADLKVLGGAFLRAATDQLILAALENAGGSQSSAGRPTVWAGPREYSHRPPYRPGTQIRFMEQELEFGPFEPEKFREDLAELIFSLTRIRTRGVGLIDDFFADRLKVQQREAGVRHDLIDAVFALGEEDDLVRLLSRVEALQAFVGTEDGVNLLAAYKRAANILKAETRDASPVLDEGTKAPLAAPKEQQIPQTGEEDPFVDVDQGMRKAIAGNPGRTEGTIPEGAAAADIALLGALDIAENEARGAVAEERFGDAMAALASLRAPIDRFFDEVMVNDEDPQKRAFRLGLLARFRDTVHAIADFSKIEG